MSNFSYDDFAVLVRNFRQDMLDSDSLRIVPLNGIVSMADAIKGTGLALEEGNAFLPLAKNGDKVSSNVTVQHKSSGYCRLVGHLEAGDEAEVTEARTFVLYRLDKEVEEVLAVASLKEGFEIGGGCYPSFTITTVNNYQSVAFNPNAFATVEDLKNINGLDGLHIAFDQATGDIKLLDKDGNVIDQANLPIKADVIIADGEEGYKYVKTDVQQDIHATKAWMPEGYTAWDDVEAALYEMKHAALVVESAVSEGDGTRMFVMEDGSYPIEMGEDGEVVYINDVLYDVSLSEDGNRWEAKQRGGDIIRIGTVETVGGSSEARKFVTESGDSYTIESNEDGNDCIYVDGVLYNIDQEPDEDGRWRARPEDDGLELLWGTIETVDISSTGNVVGITVDGEMMYAIDEETLVPSISGDDVPWLAQMPLPETGYSLRYGLDAFVWTVKDKDADIHDTFFAALNASLLSLGFHEGDDIALGTNIQALADSMVGEGGEPVDPEDYMHSEENMGQREAEIDAQRNLAKEELVAWNAQHPALTHDAHAGTRISSDGVDIRDGKLSIGDGAGLDPNDGVKRYELSTNFDDWNGLENTGLALSVVDASDGNPRNVLTISESSYISGAPICMAMLEILDADGLQGDVKRRTACFDCVMSEDADSGTVNITITDNRSHSKGFGDDCIVEISPVYISGETAPEMLPALNTVNTVATVSEDDSTQLTCTCPQIIDWANSVNLNESDARLFAIVKVY